MTLRLCAGFGLRVQKPKLLNPAIDLRADGRADLLNDPEPGTTKSSEHEGLGLWEF